MILYHGSNVIVDQPETYQAKSIPGLPVLDFILPLTGSRQ